MRKLEPTKMVAWDIKRYVEIVLSLVFLFGENCAFFGKEKREEPRFLFFQVRPWTAGCMRTIDKFLSARVDDTMWLRRALHETILLSLDLLRRNSLVDRDRRYGPIKVYLAESIGPQKLVTLCRLIDERPDYWTGELGRALLLDLKGIVM